MTIGLRPCLACEQQKSQPQYWVKAGEIRDDLSFEYVCNHGHVSRVILETQKFEILFDMGAAALLDGYCREAVSSFAAAQERFHEFCIKVFLAKQGIPENEFNATWKLVSNQSERQVGAYYFLYLLHFNAAPATSQKAVEFRNRVIHKGYIPSSEDASEYGEFVYDYILGTLKGMMPSLRQQIAQVCNDDLQGMLRSVPAGVTARTVKSWSMIWLSGPEAKFGKRSFKEVLKVLKESHRSRLEERLEEIEEEEEEDDDDNG